MAQWTKDELKELLEAKINETQAKLKKRGHKMTPDYLAHVLSDFVIALMSDSRRRELGRLEKWQEENAHADVKNYVSERKRVVTMMSKALWNFAAKLEKER